MRELDAVLVALFDDHLNDFVDISQRFGLCGALCDGAERPQRRAIGVITTFIRFHYDFERVCLHSDSISAYELVAAWSIGELLAIMCSALPQTSVRRRS